MPVRRAAALWRVDHRGRQAYERADGQRRSTQGTAITIAILSPPSAGTTAHRRTFASLDGLRGVAALSVAFRHIPPNSIARWTPESYLAVDLFFVLSGFVLAHAYAARLRSGMTATAFVVARLIRLYPLYLLGTLLGLALVAAQAVVGAPPSIAVDGATIARGLAFLPTVGAAYPASLFPLDSPAWSLFFELVANLGFALVAARLGPQSLAVLVGLGAALLLRTGLHFTSLNAGFDAGNGWGGFGRVGFGFFAGVAMHRAWAAGTWRWLRLPPWLAVAAVVLIFAAAPGRAWHAAYDLGVALVIMPALVLASARADPPRALARPFAVLGVASYAIYVVQLPLAMAFTFALRHFGHPVAALGPGGALVWVATIVAVALLADRVYDVPVRAALTRAWRRRGVREDYHSRPTTPR